MAGNDDDDGVYDKSVQEWEDAHKEFLKQPDWPEGWQVTVDERNPDVLRAFWMRRGCVQCWFETHAEYDRHKPEYLRDDARRKVWVGNPEQSTRWLQKRVKNWNDPKTREKGRFTCRAHSQADLRCAVGIQGAGPEAFGIGHLTWGYQVPAVWRAFPGLDAWRVGEHSGWQGTHEEGADGPEVWQDLLDEYKLLVARRANFEEAYLRAMEVLTWPYLLPTHNCQAAVHHVLKGLGADGLPDDYFPMQATYYAWVTGAVHRLAPDRPSPEPAPPPRLPVPPARPRRRAAPKAAPRAQAAPAARAVLAPAPTPAPIPASFRRAYVTQGGAVAHLLQECPALGAAGTAPRQLRLQEAASANEAEDQLELPVCGTCRRMIDARTRIAAFEGDDALVTVLADRLELQFAGGLFTQPAAFDLQWHEVRAVELREPRLLSSNWLVLVDYKLEGDWLPSRAEVPFASREAAAACMEAIAAQLPQE